jgi:hypothetical protein
MYIVTHSRLECTEGRGRGICPELPTPPYQDGVTVLEPERIPENSHNISKDKNVKIL